MANLVKFYLKIKNLKLIYSVISTEKLLFFLHMCTYGI